MKQFILLTTLFLLIGFFPQRTLRQENCFSTYGCFISNDSIAHISRPFKINGIVYYWEIIDSDFPHYNLKDFKSKKLLIEVPVSFGDDVISVDSIEKMNSEAFVDLNFDKLKDFKYYSKGSMPMTSTTNVYIFNPKTKMFDSSDELTDTNIEEIDSVHRKLITSSFSFSSYTQKIHYFDKTGKIKYHEVITELRSDDQDSINIIKNIYEKILNGKVVKSKIYFTND